MSQLQLKRGTPERWAEVNPVLLPGEPGVEYITNKMKIGDGKTHWNDLPYLHEEAVMNAKTFYDFPTVGDTNTIYKAEEEKTLYQWNATEEKYEPLNSGGDFDPSEINLINGGNA